MLRRNQTLIVQKDLTELVGFIQNVEEMFSGYVDTWLSQLLVSGIDLASEFDKSVKQRLAEQFESLQRIPFIASGRLFK